MRQERGFGVNPWTTHSRFVISHHLLRDEDYASPLRDWLGTFAPQSLLILDEAHNAAPASGARYAIDSQFTKSVRELAPRFEHRLFQSATPHNGHSNSFSALLEILDPQRFCRGVPVESVKQLDAVMVRRLKDDLRRLVGGFPERKIVEVAIDGLAADNPELLLPQLLDEYRQAREDRLKGATKSVQAAAALVICGLQKRLLSSIEAFASTLSVHRRALDAQIAKGVAAGPAPAAVANLRPLLTESPGSDDDRGEASEEDVRGEEDAAMEAATARTVAGSGADAFARERDLLARMAEVAETVRGRPDERVKRLSQWVREHPGKRVLIFTEYADTKRYLEKQLRASLTPGREADAMIATFHGGMVDEAREDVKRAFNSAPAKNPLRVLIATDAAREGVNLQNYCADLFHFDVPWNPSQLEQRNGRIDRNLQREDEVRCHYFVYTQRPEDRVLKALVEKTKTIRKQLGSLAPVLERRLEDRLANGFARRDADALAKSIEGEQIDPDKAQVAQDELESGRKREQELVKQTEELQDLLKKSRDWLRLETHDLEQTISCGLELLGAKPLASGADAGVFTLPDAASRFESDPSWAHTLDTLRAPKRKGPWLGANSRERCGDGGQKAVQPNRLLIRAASNAYFAQTLSAISIPEPGAKLRAAVEEVWAKYLQSVTSLQTLAVIRTLPEVKLALESFSDDEVWAEIERRALGAVPAVKGIRAAELETLLESPDQVGDDQPDGWFFARTVPIPKGSLGSRSRSPGL